MLSVRGYKRVWAPRALQRGSRGVLNLAKGEWILLANERVAEKGEGRDSRNVAR